MSHCVMWFLDVLCVVMYRKILPWISLFSSWFIDSYQAFLLSIFLVSLLLNRVKFSWIVSQWINSQFSWIVSQWINSQFYWVDSNVDSIKFSFSMSESIQIMLNRIMKTFWLWLNRFIRFWIVSIFIWEHLNWFWCVSIFIVILLVF